MQKRRRTGSHNDQLIHKVNEGLSIVLTVLFLALLINVEQMIFPIYDFLQEEEEGSRRVMSLLGVLPLYQYTYQREEYKNNNESGNILKYVMNANENVDVSVETENELALEEAVKKEQNIDTESDTNCEYIDLEEYSKIDGQTDETDEASSSQIIPDIIDDSIIRAKSPSMLYDLTQFADTDLLIKEFYTIDTSTAVTDHKLDIDSLLSYDLTLEPGSDQPQILIYHAHSQEAFVDSVPGDKTTTIIGAGDRLTELLRSYGYNVMHHTSEYDVEIRDEAYSKAAPALERILEENPSIEVIIDLHRDDLTDVKLVTEIDGKPVAKIMFFNGLSNSNQLGDITYLPNPNQKENLAFSFQEQVLANEYYPGLMRKIYLRGSRYNMQYRGRYMLIELGGNTNTVE